MTVSVETDLAVQPSRRVREITGTHVLIAMLCFFGVVFAVNGIFLYQAIGSYTGLVANEPYRKGLAYNERIAAASAQAARGWSHNVVLDQTGRVELRVVDPDGGAVSNLVWDVEIGRPTTDAHDRHLRLVETEVGTYAGSVGAVEHGMWIAKLTGYHAASAPSIRTTGTDEKGEAPAVEASVNTSAAETIVYRAKERLWLKP